MSRIFFLLMTIVIVSVSCSEPSGKKKEEFKYEKSKETVEEIEKKNPLKFIVVEVKNKKNLIGQSVVKGVVRSKASVAVYKDIVLRVSFISETGAVLENDEETMHEYLRPGASIEFKSKFFPPKETHQVLVSVISAKAE